MANAELTQRAKDFLAGFMCGQKDEGHPVHYFTGYIFDDWNPDDPNSVRPSPELVSEALKAITVAAHFYAERAERG